ncbi:tyrosine-type recombinase/integrase [Nocardia wallacei]|uniref:tyrosine-type recombinase/integrase n=1 Tax=Nocardia wallacei TaxID=480035 RepID=UPI002455370A|nr:site-specific integrase [Nocardia wallacei]
MLDTVVLPRWGSIPLRDIEFEGIQEWVVKLSKSGSSRFEGRGLSASRVTQSYQILDRVLRFAIKSKRLATNPADDIDLPSIQAGERRYLTHLEVMKLALAAGRFRALVFTLAYTGIRFGEATALRAVDIDQDRRRIRVSRSASGVTGQGVVETDAKNHTTREVPVPEFLAAEMAWKVDGLPPRALVYPGRTGEYLTSSEFRWGSDQAVSATGLTGVVPHGLRHTAASLAIRAGANIKVVQKMLGHKTATLTLDLYGHLYPDDLDTVAVRMQAGAESAAGRGLRTQG